MMKKNSYSEEKDTRSQILCASIHLFATHGYDGTSIREIVAAAGVTKPVLYYYYKNKEDLYLNILKEVYAFFFSKLEPLLAEKGDFITRLRHLTQLYFGLSHDFPDAIRMICDGLFFPKRNPPPVELLWENEHRHMELIKNFFDEGMKNKIFRTDNVNYIVTHYLGAVNVYILSRITEQDPIPENVDEIIVDYVMHGIGKGKK